MSKHEDISVVQYFEELLNIVQENSLRGIDLEYPDLQKPRIDWGHFREEAWRLLNNAHIDNISDERMSAVIQSTLGLLDDGHSHCPDYFKTLENTFNPIAKVDPLHAEIIDDVAYLRVPRELVALEQMHDFAGTIRDAIIELDDTNLKGWIIDLRASYGGGMWATLHGLWPLLPEQDAAGYFLKPDEQPVCWGPMNNVPSDPRSLPDYTLQSKGSPIAVLTGTHTSSAGEALTIAFKGLDNVTSFGQPTHGETTGNRSFFLPDGRSIALTSSIYADRNLRAYGGQIHPDICIKGNYDHIFTGKPIEQQDYNLNDDIVLASATHWINDPAEFLSKSIEQNLQSTAHQRACGTLPK